MNKKKLIIVGVLLLSVFTIGIVTVKVLLSPKIETKVAVEENPPEIVVPLAQSVLVNVTKSKTKDNTIVLDVSGLQGKYTSVAYELSYDSAGIVQGVTTKPLDVAGKNSFIRDDIYLGTCSRNVCRPHPGVTKVSLALEFTTPAGTTSQFTKDFDL